MTKQPGFFTGKHVGINISTALGPSDPDDGDYGRQQRGLAIANLLEEHIRPDPMGFKVTSQSGNGGYLVNFDRGDYCTCPDYEKRKLACKHIYSVKAFLQRQEHPDDAETEPVGVRITSTQHWIAYNTAQVHEGELFETLLRELCDTVRSRSIIRPCLKLRSACIGTMALLFPHIYPHK